MFYVFFQRPGPQQMPNMPNMAGAGRPGPGGPHPGMAGNIQQGNVPPGIVGNNMNMGMGKCNQTKVEI